MEQAGSTLGEVRLDTEAAACVRLGCRRGRELLVQGEVFEGELAVAATKKGQKAKCWSRRVIIEPGSSPDQSRQINHFPPD